MSSTRGRRTSSGSQGLMRKKSARLLGSTPGSSRAASWARVLRRGATTRRSAKRATCWSWGALKVRPKRPTKVTTAAERRTMAFMGPPGQQNSKFSHCRFTPEAPPCPSLLARVQDVVKLRSNVRLEGVFLHEGESVQVVDPETGNEQLDQ